MQTHSHEFIKEKFIRRIIGLSSVSFSIFQKSNTRPKSFLLAIWLPPVWLRSFNPPLCHSPFASRLLSFRQRRRITFAVSWLPVDVLLCRSPWDFFLLLFSLLVSLLSLLSVFLFLAFFWSPSSFSSLRIVLLFSPGLPSFLAYIFYLASPGSHCSLSAKVLSLLSSFLSSAAPLSSEIALSLFSSPRCSTFLYAPRFLLLFHFPYPSHVPFQRALTFLPSLRANPHPMRFAISRKPPLSISTSPPLHLPFSLLLPPSSPS